MWVSARFRYFRYELQDVGFPAQLRAQMFVRYDSVRVQNSEEPTGIFVIFYRENSCQAVPHPILGITISHSHPAIR